MNQKPLPASLGILFMIVWFVVVGFCLCDLLLALVQVIILFVDLPNDSFEFIFSQISWAFSRVAVNIALMGLATLGLFLRNGYRTVLSSPSA